MGQATRRFMERCGRPLYTDDVLYGDAVLRFGRTRSPGRSVPARRAGGALLLALLLPASTARATDYYVDASSPNCSSSGPGTELQPYCTISSAVAAHQGPGVRILVKPGLYREQVTIPASGSDGNPFVLQALGHVVVDGSDDFSAAGLWSSYADDVYLAPSVTWNPLQVFVGGARWTPSSAEPASLPERTFRWVPGEGLYVNWADHDPGEVELLIGRRPYGFNLFAKSWITVEGFTVRHTESRGIHVNAGCTDVLIARDTVSFSKVYGIQVVNGQRVVVESCRSSDNQLHGFGLTAGSTSCIVRNNESLRNVDPAVRRARIEKDRSLIERMILTFGRQPRVERVMLLDRHGGARYASVPLQAEDLSLSSPTCQACHRYPPEQRGSSRVIDSRGGEVLRTVIPVRNREACYGCHDPSHRINGVVILDVNAEEIRAEMNADLRLLVIGTCALALLLVGAIGLVGVLWRRRHRPVARR